jgi:O-antigen/teichoic acid export membrane protein
VSRVARSALNFAASTGASVVGMLAAFVATPIVLRELGADRLGAFRAATEWAGYLALLELGVAGALAPLIAQAAAAGDRERLGAILAAGARAYVRVALWTLLAGIALWAVLPVLVRVPPELEGELRVGFGLAIGAAVFLPLAIYRPLADALQRGYLVSALLGVQVTLTAAACALAALSGWGLPGQFGVTAACALIVPLGLLAVFRRVAPPSALLRRPPELDAEARRLRGLNRTTLVYQLVGRVCVFTDNIVIGLFLGPAAVASFFLTTRLPQDASAKVQAVGSATWAGLAELHHSGNHELFRRRLTELTRLTAVLAGAVVIPLAALTAPFVSLWVGPAQYAGDTVVALAILNGVLLPVFSLWGWVFTGTGRVAVLVPYMIGQGVLNLAVSLVATWLVGLPGPLIGTAFVNLLYNPVMLGRLLRAEFGVRPREVVLAALLPLVPAAMILGVLVVEHAAWPGESWGRLAGEFIAAAGLYLVVAWRLVLGDSERATLGGLVRRALGRSSSTPAGTAP